MKLCVYLPKDFHFLNIMLEKCKKLRKSAQLAGVSRPLVVSVGVKT